MNIDLKYGCNPHQKPAVVNFYGSKPPLEIVNGKPGYINLLDAFSAWQLAKELKNATGKEGASSFKHVSPAGAAIAKPLTSEYLESQFLTKKEYSDVTTAYIRARGGDRMSSYGDAAAVSGKVDISLAEFLKHEVCDLIIAPDFDSEALEILKQKKKGEFVILKIDPEYEPDEIEKRNFYGFEFSQLRNTAQITKDIFSNVVSKNKDLTESELESLIVATIALKYTQSNSVCVAYDGQIIGTGAGQQSRIHCTRLACDKAEKWLLQQSAEIRNIKFPSHYKKVDKANLIDQILIYGTLFEEEKSTIQKNIGQSIPQFSLQEKMKYFQQFNGICISSDAYFPFRDNIERAHKTHISCIAHAGGSVRDTGVLNAADEYNMKLIQTGLRLFTH